MMTDDGFPSMGWRSHLNRVSRWGILRGDMLSRFGRAFWGYNESFPTDKWVLLPHPIKKVNVGHVGYTYIYIYIHYPMNIPWNPFMNGRLLVHIPISLDTISAFCDPLGRPFELFFTPQVIGAVIGAAWHMAREKVSTNWAKVPILGGLQCHQERGNVATFKENRGRQKKMYSEWQIDHSYQSICLLSNQLTYQKKRHFFFMWFKVGDTCFPSWKHAAFCSCRCFAKRPPWYQR